MGLGSSMVVRKILSMDLTVVVAASASSVVLPSLDGRRSEFCTESSSDLESSSKPEWSSQRESSQWKSTTPESRW